MATENGATGRETPPRRDPPWLTPDISVPVVPPLINTASMRDERELEALLDQFHVESALRYRPRALVEGGPKLTYCNLLVSDVTRALCAPVPHWLDGQWQDVRSNVKWLRSGYNGWKPCTAVEAQRAANVGHPSVVAWDPPERAHGHIAMLTPSKGSAGVWLMQAGARCYRRAPLMVGFGAHTQELIFYTHE